jgi:hypothetical protein
MPTCICLRDVLEEHIALIFRIKNISNQKLLLALFFDPEDECGMFL